MKLLRKRYIVAIGGLSALLVTLSYTFYFNGSPEVRGNQLHRAVKESSRAKSTFYSEQPAIQTEAKQQTSNTVQPPHP